MIRSNREKGMKFKNGMLKQETYSTHYQNIFLVKLKSIYVLVKIELTIRRFIKNIFIVL